jgi:hypothetical protein
MPHPDDKPDRDGDPLESDSLADHLEQSNPMKSDPDINPSNDPTPDEGDDLDDLDDSSIDDHAEEDGEEEDEEPLFPPLPWNPPDPPFEPEWLDPPPRTFDKSAFQGSHQLDRHLQSSFSLITGVFFIAVSYLPAAQEAAFFLPILSWLLWIGVGFILLGAIINIRSGGAEGPFRFLRDGVPLLVRCRSIQPKSHGGENPMWCYQVWVDHPDPVTGEMLFHLLKSKQFTSQYFPKMEITYRVGDYVTAVYLPESMKETLTLYGFLGLKKDLGAINSTERSPWFATEANFGCAIVWIFFGTFLWSIYVLFRYFPVSWNLASLTPWALYGALGVGVPLQVWHVFRERRKRLDRGEVRTKLGKPNLPTSTVGDWVGLPFSLALWGGVSLMLGLSLNALLDHAPGIEKPIAITKLRQHESRILGLPSLRDFHIEYHFLDDPTRRTRLATPAEMDGLQVGPARAIVAQGQQGWPWVQKILPPAQ